MAGVISLSRQDAMEWSRKMDSPSLVAGEKTVFVNLCWYSSGCIISSGKATLLRGEGKKRHWKFEKTSLKRMRE